MVVSDTFRSAITFFSLRTIRKNKIEAKGLRNNTELLVYDVNRRPN